MKMQDHVEYHLKFLKERVYQRTSVLKDPSVPFFPYQINNNAEGDPSYSGNNTLPLQIEALNSTI